MVGSSVADEFKLLRSCLETIPDPRHARGKVHPLVGILGLIVLGLMAGARSDLVSSTPKSCRSFDLDVKPAVEAVRRAQQVSPTSGPG